MIVQRGRRLDAGDSFLRFPESIMSTLQSNTKARARPDSRSSMICWKCTVYRCLNQHLLLLLRLCGCSHRSSNFDASKSMPTPPLGCKNWRIPSFGPTPQFQSSSLLLCCIMPWRTIYAGYCIHGLGSALTDFGTGCHMLACVRC